MRSGVCRARVCFACHMLVALGGSPPLIVHDADPTGFMRVHTYSYFCFAGVIPEYEVYRDEMAFRARRARMARRDTGR